MCREGCQELGGGGGRGVCVAGGSGRGQVGGYISMYICMSVSIYAFTLHMCLYVSIFVFINVSI
jgi:hypothetical protein